MITNTILLVLAMIAATLAVDCTMGNDLNTYNTGKAQAKAQWESSISFTGCDKLEQVLDITTSNAPTNPPCLALGFEDQLADSYMSSCKTCGEDLAQEKWGMALSRIGDTCAYADQVLVDTLDAAPNSPQCRYDAYTDKIQALYAAKFADCVEECVGAGKASGWRLGQQFCDIAFISSAGSGSSVVVAICNLEEQRACENEMESFVQLRCPEKLNLPENLEFYRELEAGCAITVGPDA